MRRVWVENPWQRQTPDDRRNDVEIESIPATSDELKKYEEQAKAYLVAYLVN